MATDHLLRFTPHIPRRQYANGWTADRQIAFIAELARTGVVSHAARSVGMTPRSAYTLRATVRNRYSNWADVPMSPERAAALGPGYIYSFAAAWDRALACGVKLQTDTATPLAIRGERVPILWRGRIVGWRRRFNERLMIAAMGAYRRVNEGQSLDHDRRIALRTAEATEKIEALLRLGPIIWPEPAPREDPDARRERLRRERRLDRLYGKPQDGLRDSMRPAGTPMRTLAAQEAAADLVRAGRAAGPLVMKLRGRATEYHDSREICEAKPNRHRNHSVMETTFWSLQNPT